MKRMRHLHMAGVALVAIGGPTSVAQAQTADAPAAAETDAAADQGQLGDIVVTAQRRSESLQKVPVAIAAFNPVALTNAGIANAQDLAKLSPSMVVNNSGGQFSAFIRGVGNRLIQPGLDPSIAAYVDDRYEGSATATLVQLLDVARVEVIKGPQGVLFGRNASGGAIRVITNDPQDSFGGSMRLTYGNYDTREARGTLNIPVTSNMATRFSGLYLKHDGYLKNVFSTGLRRLDDADLVQIRNKTNWDITPSLTAKLSVEYWREKDTAGQGFVLLPPLNLNPLIVAGAVTGVAPGTVATAINRKTRQNQLSGQFRLEKDLGSVNLASISTFARLTTHLVGEVDATSAVAQDTRDFYVGRKVFTQEVQAVSNTGGSLEWLLGGFYLHEKINSRVLTDVPITLSVIGDEHIKTDSVAAFGQITYKVMDTLSLILGGRFSHEKKSILVTQTPGYTNLNAALMPFRAEVKASRFTPRAVLQWQYSPDGMIYLSYSRGTKSGGFSFPAAGSPTLLPETLDSYELGWKADLLDRHLRISSAAFYYDYKNLQVNRATSLPGGITSFQASNAATSTIKGLEADVVVSPFDGLTFNGSVTYLDAKYDKFDATARVFRVETATPGNGLGTVIVPFNAAGKRMLFAPKWSGSLGATYTVDAGPGELSASATLLMKSGYEFDFVASPLMRVLHQSGYSTLSGRIAYELKAPEVTIALYGNNLTKARYLVDASVSSGGPKGTYAQPRTYGVQISYSF